MNKILYVLMGPPSVGKSTYAKGLRDKNSWLTVVSADDYFMKDGAYQFNQKLLGLAHKTCEQLAASKMAIGLPVVVDNNNCKLNQFSFYLRLAETFAYQVEFVVFSVSENDLDRLFERNTHGVSKEIIARRIKELSLARTNLKRNMKVAYPGIRYNIITVYPFSTRKE